eukprot:scaffold2830_cov131-Cylindrotheca_fusiformis.AAC.87
MVADWEVILFFCSLCARLRYLHGIITQMHCVLGTMGGKTRRMASGLLECRMYTMAGNWPTVSQHRFLRSAAAVPSTSLLPVHVLCQIHHSTIVPFHDFVVFQSAAVSCPSLCPILFIIIAKVALFYTIHVELYHWPDDGAPLWAEASFISSMELDCLLCLLRGVLLGLASSTFYFLCILYAKSIIPYCAIVSFVVFQSAAVLCPSLCPIIIIIIAKVAVFYTIHVVLYHWPDGGAPMWAEASYFFFDGVGQQCSMG